MIFVAIRGEKKIVQHYNRYINCLVSGCLKKHKYKNLNCLWFLIPEAVQRNNSSKKQNIVVIENVSGQI
jgi:heme oxygenase